MGAPESRNPPGVAGFESADHRLGLHTHPTTPRVGLPAPRAPQAVTSDLYQAAERLADIAEDLAAGTPTDRVLSAADALLIGCGRLITELRQQRVART